MKSYFEKENKFGSGYFSINPLSTQKRDQLLKPSRSNNLTLISNNPPYLIRNIKKESEYIDSLKNDIQFSTDVAAERCIHLLPYSNRFYDSLYDVKKNLKQKKQLLTKLAHSVPKVHHCNQTVKEVKLSKLPPVQLGRHNDDGDVGNVSDITSMADTNNDTSVAMNRKHWDEYFISLLSPSTAQYIAFEASHNDSQAQRLQELVRKWYGPEPTYRELVPDDADDGSGEATSKDLRTTFPYKYYMDQVTSQRATSKPLKDVDSFHIEGTTKQKITNILSREISFYDEDQQTDPYGEDTKASFYRLPGLLRRQKKNTEILEKDSGNKTAEKIKEFVLPHTPPKRLNTAFNPKIGDKILISDNQFQQDLLISTDQNQKKLINEPDDMIMIENKLYRKNLQPVWPTVVTSKMPSEEYLDASRPPRNHLIKGHNRWIDLPQREESNLRSIVETSSLEENDRLESRKRTRNHSSVNLIVDQWRKKWQLTQKYNDSRVEDLLKDMTDAHPTIRMQAIVTVAKSGSHATMLSDDPSNGLRKETIPPDVIPKVLMESIEILLDDTHQQVKKAAAVALHSLESPTEKSLKILRQMLGSGSNVDRWTAAQCLALSNTCDSHVISELVDQLMNSEDILVHEKASILLAKISFHTKLAHGLLGEKLNTVSWRQRIIICKTMPLLHGSLNKDILRKLIYLMWQDPHKQVRIAASQVVGKTGNGKAVHEELIKKLQHNSETIRADALEKIGILKVMTTRMMPAFLRCFSDDFVIVRKEVCRTCYRLEIQDVECVRNMLSLVRYDSSYQVKIYALRALGKIHLENPDLRSCFLWALLYEAETRVRYEALHSLLGSTKIDKEIVDLLKSRFLVEDDKHIAKLLRTTLNSVGINPDEDIDTVAEVKSEVRRFLSDKNHITDVILDNEAAEDYALQREVMLASSSEESSASSSDAEDFMQEDISKDLKVLINNMEKSHSMSSIYDGGENISTHDNVEYEGDARVLLESGLNIPEDHNYLAEEDDEIEGGVEVGCVSKEIMHGALNSIRIEEKENEDDNSKECLKGEEDDKNSAEEGDVVKEEEAIVKEILDDIIGEVLENVDLLGDINERKANDDNGDKGLRRTQLESRELTVPDLEREVSNEERFSSSKDIRDSVDLCTYKLPSDTSYLKVLSFDKSMTWMTLETPVIVTDPTQLDMLESTICSSIMEMVNEAIEFEGIDCGTIDQ